VTEPSAARFLQDLAVILTTAAFATLVFQRLRLPVIAGYLVAGILVGPEVAPALVTDAESIRTLAELGVVLLMTSVGLEFRVSKLLRLGPRVGLTALIEVGVMFSAGLVVARLLGWGPLDSLLVAGIVAISSTMVIAKVFDERHEDWRLRDLVFGVLVMEDLVAIALVAICTTVAFGAALTAGSVAVVLGRVAIVLIGLLVIGLLVVPPVVRFVVRRHGSETTLVTVLGLSFLAAYLTQAAGFSVALGAFVAGVLMSESGVSHQVSEVIRPVRDLFAAVFFVAVGMLLDLQGTLAVWPLVLLFTALVVGGKIAGVTAGAFLNGFGIRTSLRAGMSMAQIGEFSFIIAGLGVTSERSVAPLYPIAVATALLTAFLAPGLAARSEAAALWLDRRLPHPLQTFATLYGSWVESVFRARSVAPPGPTRRLVRLLALDTLVIAAILVGTSLVYRRSLGWLARLGLPESLDRGVVLGAGALLALPFAFGLMLAIRRLARTLGEAVVSPVAPGKVDQGRAPRRVLIVTLEIALVVATGLPLVVATLPFLPPYGAPGVIAVLLLLLSVAFWRTARDLDSHARAGAELVAHVLARQGARADAESFGVVRRMLPGLGNVVPIRVGPESAVVGKSLGELNLRGRTGATVVALSRGEGRTVFPEAGERLAAGDLIAVTGSEEAISRAEALVRATDTS
jgi:CPA2 family monovalent cation:H+ antiporter-2